MKNLILVFTMLLSTMTFAQTNAKTVSLKQGAAMSFAKTTVDYGTIAKGSNKFRTIAFSNDGTEPLIIKSAKGSCGCTIPTFPKEPIAPGATAEIKIKYDTKRLGAINKTVTIQSNAGVKILKVKGNITQKASTPKKEGRSILDQK